MIPEKIWGPEQARQIFADFKLKLYISLIK